MSYTNSDFIRDTLKSLGVLAGVDRAPSPNQGEDGLHALNDMMLEWGKAGINLEYSLQSDLTADCAIEEGDRLTVRANLAIVIASAYGRQVPPEIIALAQSGYERLSRDAVLDSQVEQSTQNMSRDEPRARAGNILTG